MSELEVHEPKNTVINSESAFPMTLVSHCIKNHFTLKVKCTASLSGQTRVILLPRVKEEDEERKGKYPPISHLKRDLIMTLFYFFTLRPNQHSSCLQKFW